MFWVRRQASPKKHFKCYHAITSGFPDKQRPTANCPDAILVVPIKRATRIRFRYPWRSREGCGENREHSAPASATPPASKFRHPSQLPEERRIHLVDVTVKRPDPKFSSRPPSSSTARYVTICQGPQLKLPFIPFCKMWVGPSIDILFSLINAGSVFTAWGVFLSNHGRRQLVMCGKETGEGAGN
eukprot:1154109-Pelagomonas_calceolata.AAC.4